VEVVELWMMGSQAGVPRRGALHFGRHRPLDEPVAQAAGPAGAKGSLSALKKDDRAKAAEQKLKGTGWLPAILRAV
jgi:hypothetical protein